MAQDFAERAAAHQNADVEEFEESIRYCALFGDEADRIAAQSLE